MSAEYLVDAGPSPWAAIHRARYSFASALGVSGVVLDIACGSGYGSELLVAGGARVVVGMDRDGRALELASSRCAAVRGDALDLPFDSGVVDTVVTLETIEHLEDRVRFLGELRRVLRPGGTLILSTPNALYTKPQNGRPRNPYHIHEYESDELQHEVERFFDVQHVYGQTFRDGVRISPFYDDQVGGSGFRHRQRVVLWRVLNKLPRRITDEVAVRIWGHSLYLSEYDYVFNDELIPSAMTLVLHATSR
jgi:SAM-dependent methyltransferase